MHRLHKLSVIVLVFLLIPLFSGCLDSILDLPTTYESHPTKLSYTIRYGYEVTCSGEGLYEITYDCDIPELLQGPLSYHPLFSQDFEVVNQVDNEMIRWNLSKDDEATYTLGITASVISESYLLPDLSGTGSVTIDDIQTIYPIITDSYLQPQSNGSATLIDPLNPSIQTIAHTIAIDAQTDNVFLLAKEVFIWLKENTQYTIHNNYGSVQPASVTLSRYSGDCDDLSFLYISLCRSLGIPARFIRGFLLSDETAGVVLTTPHAWTEVFVGGTLGNNGWIPVECACVCDDIEVNINQNYGVENAFHLRLFTDAGSNESLNISLSGISYITHGMKRSIYLESFAEIEDYQVLESKKLIVESSGQRYYQE